MPKSPEEYRDSSVFPEYAEQQRGNETMLPTPEHVFTLTHRGQSDDVALYRVVGVQHVEYNLSRSSTPSGIIYQDKTGNWINKTTWENLGTDLQQAAQATYTENQNRVYGENE